MNSITSSDCNKTFISDDVGNQSYGRTIPQPQEKYCR